MLERHRWSAVVFAMWLSGSASAAWGEPLDKAKPASLRAIAKGKILGLHVAEVKVDDDGALRLRAGLDVECGTVAGIKKVEGVCIAALPLGELRAVELAGSLTFGRSGVPIAMTGVVQPGGWLSFRATRLSALAAIASVDGSTQGGVFLSLVPRKNDWWTGTDTVASLPDPEWIEAAPATDRLVPYYSSSEECWHCYDLDDPCFAGMDVDVPADEEVLEVPFPLSWFAYSGRAMRTGQEASLLREYERLAGTRSALFWTVAADELPYLRQVPEGSSGAAALSDLVARMPVLLANRLATIRDLPPALDRTAVIYEDTQLLLAHQAQRSAAIAPTGPAAAVAGSDPGREPAGREKGDEPSSAEDGDDDRTERRPGPAALADPFGPTPHDDAPPPGVPTGGMAELRAFVADDVAAFSAARSPIAAGSLDAWSSTHRALLRDPRHPEVFVAWTAARAAARQSGLPIGGGAFDAVVQAAMDRGFAGELTARARADVDAVFGQEIVFPHGGGAATETFANVAWFLELSWDRIAQDPDGVVLIRRFAELLVAHPRFAPELPERLLGAHPSFFRTTEAGQRIALEIVPRIDARKRADRHARIEELAAAARRIAPQCQRSVKQLKALDAVWRKRFLRMKPRERASMQQKGNGFALEIQRHQGQLRGIAEQLKALEAWDEAGVAQRELAACKF